MFPMGIDVSLTVIVSGGHVLKWNIINAMWNAIENVVYIKCNLA